MSSDGRVALLRVQYPVRDELAQSDFDQLLNLGERARVDSTLQVEMGGDIFFEFAEPETSTAELVGLLAAVLILFLAFGSLIAMGLPIGMAILRARGQHQLDVALDVSPRRSLLDE